MKGNSNFMQTLDLVKQKLGEKAASLITGQKIIGLGSGSTAALFIQSLAILYKEKQLKSVCLATSDQSEKLARSLGLPLLSFSSWNKEEIDILIDGADCVDGEGNLIKGLGGALLREKLVAFATKRYVIIVDESKRKPYLQGKLPLEITPYGLSHTIQRIEQAGYTGNIRKNERGGSFSTDNGNKIFDIDLPNTSLLVDELHSLLKGITGVVETGLFLHRKPELITGYLDGRIIHEVL